MEDRLPTVGSKQTERPPLASTNGGKQQEVSGTVQQEPDIDRPPAKRACPDLKRLAALP